MRRKALRPFISLSRSSQRTLLRRRILAFEPLEDRSLLAAVPTLTTLGVSAASLTYGQAETLTATVIVASPYTGTPTGGTVTFLNGSTLLGTATLNSGTATLQVSTLPVGTDLLMATYGGTSSFAGSSTAVGPSSIITTVAGNGTTYSGNGIAAAAAELGLPADVALDSAGNIFIADTNNNRIREVSHASGVITTVAGKGTSGDTGDNGPATDAELNSPEGIVVNTAGELFIADTGNNRVREINLSTGVITTVAGNGTAGYSGDGGQATAAELSGPCGVAIDSVGDLFIADTGNARIRAVNIATGMITTVAGNGTSAYSGDYGLATAAELDLPSRVAVDSGGNILLIADSGNSRVREVNLATDAIITVAGDGTQGNGGDNGPATDAELNYPEGIAVDSVGDIFIADSTSGNIREVNHATGAITTVAGNDAWGGAGDNGPATAAAMDSPEGVAIDSAGNLFIADTEDNRIREVTRATGIITTVAGGGAGGDNGPATAAEVDFPCGVAVESAGDLFIADTRNNRVREVDLSTGVITTVAGNGTAGFTGDNGAATAAELNYPSGVAMDSAGDLFIVDALNSVIREVNVSTGVITTVAGGGSNGLGDHGPATAAELADPQSVAVDSAGDLFIADPSDDRIREVLHATGVITTVAGNGASGYTGDNGLATAAELDSPRGVAVDSAGDLFIIDDLDDVVREVNHATGVITTVAGNGTAGYSGDKGPATAAELDYPEDVAVDSAGDLFIGDVGNGRIREVNHSTGVITTLAGGGNPANGIGDNGPATAAELAGPWSVAVDSAGDLFIADTDSNRIREITSGVPVHVAAPTPTATSLQVSATSLVYGQPETLTATVTSSNGTPTSGTVTFYNGNTALGTTSLDPSSGTALFSDSTLPAGTDVLRAVYSGGGTFAGSSTTIGPNSTITTAAGNGTAGYTGDDGPATAAELANPASVAVDSAGDLFIADSANHVVREVNYTTGAITTIAGNGIAGFSGDNGPATAAKLNDPTGVAVDTSGDLFIADSSDDRVREVNLSTGVITTVAGNGTAGYNGDNFSAITAELANPESVAVDSSGDLFIADAGNNRIREVNLSSGVITTFAGDGTNGYNGDSDPATAAELRYPSGIAVDSAGDLFIADSNNDVVREVNHSTGVITTVAGNGTQGYAGDSGQATAAELDDPTGVAVDSSGDLYVADRGNQVIREVNLTGVITTAAGDGTNGYGGDNNPATAAELRYPSGVALDSSGDLFIADTYNNRIREVGNTVSTLVAQATPTITWASPADITYGTALEPTQLDATASAVVDGVTVNVPGTFVYSPTSGTVLNAGKNQTLSVTFTPTDATDYTTATASVSINVNQATPTITWATPADITYGTALEPTQLDATASAVVDGVPVNVPGTFVYSPISGTVLNAGKDQTLSVTFTPTDATDYTPATKSVSINVNRATPTITWATPADITYGTALGPTQLDATASAVVDGVTVNVPGTFAYSPTSGTVLNAGKNQTLSVTFTPTDATDFTTATASVSINVAQATPTITWVSPADITYGTALEPTQLDATASAVVDGVTVNVPGTFVYSPISGTVLNAGENQTLSVTFTPTDATDYTPATKSVSINVNQATPTITWASPADITYGTALGPTQLDATASAVVDGVTVNVPGTFVHSPISGTVLNAGKNQTLSVTFTPTDATDYTPATKSVSINVNQATPTITWASPADITYGTALGPTQLDATASAVVDGVTVNVPGTFAYSPTSGTVLNAGKDQTLSVTFTPTDATDFTPATASVSTNVNQATPTITWASPADITYGTALGPTQLDATASAVVGGVPVNVPGTFVYSPTSGTVLNAGKKNQTLSVTFTPTDATDFTPATASVSIDVNQATPTVTVNAVDITYGTALANGQLSGTASWTVNGSPINVLGTFSYTTAAGDVLNAGNGQTEAVTFQPNDSTDYQSVPTSVTVNVAQASLTITAVTNTKTYDGNNSAATQPTVSGLQGGDTVKDLSETYDNKNAGSGKTLTVAAGYVVNDGNSGNNYIVTTVPSTAGVITKAPLTITAVPNTKFFDGTTSAAASPIVIGLQDGDRVTDLRETYDTIEEGLTKTLTVAPGYVINDGNGGNNYLVATVPATGAIIQLKLQPIQGVTHGPPPPPTTLHLLTPSTLASTLAAAASTTGLDRAGSGTAPSAGPSRSEQVSGSEMLSGGQGTDGGNLHDVVLLAVKGLTVPPTNTFEAGDLPPEPTPPQPVDDAPEEPPSVPDFTKPYITGYGSNGQSELPPAGQQQQQQQQQQQSRWPLYLSIGAMLTSFSGFFWHRSYARRRRRLLDTPMFAPASAAAALDGNESRPSSIRLSMEELEHGQR